MSSSFQPFHFSSSDGLKLYGRKYGWEKKDAHPVLCLPGLTRNSSDFDTLARFLASEKGGNRRVITFDYRGRGNSEYDTDWQNYTILKEAEDVISGLTAIGIAHVDLIGTSRGGLIAMVLAASRPGLMKSVILNDIGPELDGPGLVKIKRNMERSKTPTSLNEAAKFLELHHKASFPDLKAEDWQEQANQVYREENGKLSTRYDPKLVNSMRAINLDVRLADMWPQFKGLSNHPMMLIHGALSDLITQPILEKMTATNPKLHVHTVENQGHAPLLKDKPTQTAIAKFLSSNS